MVYILSLQNLVSNSTGGTNSSAGGVLPTNEVNDQVTHGYGSVTASPYSVEEVSGSRPGRVILKT